MPKGRQNVSHKRAKAQPQRQRRQLSRSAKHNQRSKWTSSSNAAKIQEYMTSHGIVRKPIIGDGNCLFRAMADQLGYGEHRHREIREKVVEAIRADKEYFANFIDGSEVDGVDAYCDEMIQDGVWGDDIELEAFRRAYGRAIVIYDASTGTPYVKPWKGDEGKSPNTVHLWKSDCHYESVRNKDGPFDGPSRVVYKDVKITPQEVERIKKDYEDAVVEELIQALSDTHVTEIRRLVKEFDGDGNKVLEYFTGVDSAAISDQKPPTGEPHTDQLPNGVPEHPQQDPQDVLSLNAEQSPSAHAETSPGSESMAPEILSDLGDPKHKAQQRRLVSAARKEKQAKRAQKEAARRRKRMEALGIEGPSDTTETAQQSSILKAIVI